METAQERGARLLAEYSKALPRVFGDPFLDGIGNVDPRLASESTGHIYAYALGYLQELAARVRDHCGEAGTDAESKVESCKLLVSLAASAAKLTQFIAEDNLAEMRAVVERMAAFPCLFSAHPEQRKALEKFALEDLALGKSHSLRLRSPSGRKTFSYEPFTNALLHHYLAVIRHRAQESLKFRLDNAFTPAADAPLTEEERLVQEVPLTTSNAKEWIDCIWKLVLVDYPTPESHEDLSRLGTRRSRVDRAHVGKKAVTAADPSEKWTPTQVAIIRNSIKEGLLKRLRRLIRKEPTPTK